MNWDELAGKWKQSTGKVKEKWGKLTDDDLARINGKREQLVGIIQERYGIAKEAAEKQVDEFTRSYRVALRRRSRGLRAATVPSASRHPNHRVPGSAVGQTAPSVYAISRFAR